MEIFLKDKNKKKKKNPYFYRRWFSSLVSYRLDPESPKYPTIAKTTAPNNIKTIIPLIANNDENGSPLSQQCVALQVFVKFPNELLSIGIPAVKVATSNTNRITPPIIRP